MIFIIPIGSLAVFYSAWYLNLPIFSSDWFLYCFSWTPLLLIFVTAYKYDTKNDIKNKRTHERAVPALHNSMQK